ncbi:YusW family protein [Cohnella silvisoli]|uniref:YusW family protein n=1 Tax=Cohnella silvisoli TaxID=2873699 RepID=A0ABV1L247_9BACL|nr:YusW family protein [Cohnella silvisoli]MCD9025046.1 YusW family protein [Cohnella silvisoli]
MKKKIAYMLIGALCSITLTYGFVAFADKLETPSTMKDPTVVSETAKQQIVKSNEVSITLIPSPSQSQSDLNTISTTNSLNANEESFKLDQLRKLEIKINQNGLKVKIELKRENAKIESEVKIEKTGDHDSHLEGSKANQYIQQLLGSIGLNETISKQEFVDALLKKLAIDPVQAKIKVELKWNDQSSELKYEQDDKDKDQKVQKVRKKHKDKIEREDRDDSDHHDGDYNDEHDDEHDHDHDHNNDHDHDDGDEEE